MNCKGTKNRHNYEKTQINSIIYGYPDRSIGGDCSGGEAAGVHATAFADGLALTAPMAMRMRLGRGASLRGLAIRSGRWMRRGLTAVAGCGCSSSAVAALMACCMAMAVLGLAQRWMSGSFMSDGSAGYHSRINDGVL